jgi:hypothetical protein
MWNKKPSLEGKQRHGRPKQEDSTLIGKEQEGSTLTGKELQQTVDILRQQE